MVMEGGDGGGGGEQDVVSSSPPPSSLRPICLLNAMGKVYERLIKIELEEELERSAGLS